MNISFEFIAIMASLSIAVAAISMFIFVQWLFIKFARRIEEAIQRARVRIALKLKSSARFMEWLNKPQKHGKPDEEWIVGQVKVFGDEWR